jgi:hypothetical protein
MFNALKSALVGLCALAAVPLACVIVMAIVPEWTAHKARQTGAHPAQIVQWTR